MLYKYETHLHTSEVSNCARNTAEEMVRAYVDVGYTGIIVTDHFITENRKVPADWTWEQKMRFLYSGYTKAAEVGLSLGLDVFFGWEITMHGAEDYLTYDLPLDFLLAHPEISSLDLPAYSRLVRDAGGLLVRAHPFRQAHYIPPNPTVDESLIDGIEVNNGLRDDPEQFNAQAWEFARRYPFLIRTSSTDIHNIKHAGKAGMAFQKRFESMHELTDAMRRQDGFLIIDEGIYDMEGNDITSYNIKK